MKIDKEQKFILVLFILSLVARLAIAPIYVDPPSHPHDFVHYLDAARTLLQGKNPYVDYSPEVGPSPYGPLFNVLMATWIGIFGENYTLLKFPSILVDALSVVFVFYIVRNLMNAEAAKYASVVYSFSYVAIASSALEGDDDNFFIIFLLISLWYVIKSKPNLRFSAIFLGISAGFKFIPLVLFLPPVIYYILQKKGIRDVLMYVSIFAASFSIINLPFFITAGSKIFYPYSLGASIPMLGLSIPAILNMLLNYFTLEDWTQTLNVQNPFLDRLGTPITIVVFLLAGLYALKYKIENKEKELVRNIVLLTIATFLFARATYEIIWIVPFAIILFSVKYEEKFKISTHEISGIILVFLSLIIFSYIYRWRIEYSMLQRLLLTISLFMSFFGTYLTFIKSKFKLSWSFAVFSYAAYRTIHADLLMLLSTAIPMFRDYRMAWGAYAFGVAILFVCSMLFLFYEIHYKISKTEKI